jgi:hypothetical protein
MARRLFDYGRFSIAARPEIDLRKKFDEIIYGGDGLIPHGKKILHRKLRRDVNDLTIACPCVSPSSKEPNPNCSYCAGEGKFWDEHWIDGYSMYKSGEAGLTTKTRYLPPGQARVDYKVFYIRYNFDIRYGDKLIEVKLNSEGEVVLPLLRKAIYSPETIIDYRSDGGRIEYWAVYCRERDALRLDDVGI